MPLYNYSCPNCKREWEAFASIKNRRVARCTKCGRIGELLISCSSRPVILNYWSENLNAHITGPAQKKRIMKERGVEEIG